MAVRHYEVGHRHGREGKGYLEHRKGRPYASGNAQKSYTYGYTNGQHERRTAQTAELAPKLKSAEMDKKEWMKGVSLADVLKALDARAPDWAMRLADQQDFKDALRLGGMELLRRRASEKVQMVMRAYAEALLEKEQEPGEEG